MKIRKMTNTVALEPAILIITAALLGACSGSPVGGKDKDKDDTKSVAGEEGKTNEQTPPDQATEIPADKPADSTGTLTSVTLGFGRVGTAAAGLMLQESATLDVGNGVTLSDARISIGSVKLKANKEMDDGEKAMKQALKDEKKAREKAIEAQKQELEKEKEAVKAKYEPMFEGADDAEKDALKEQMKADEAAVEQKMAALEASKEAEMEALEAKKDGNLKWKGPFVYNLVDNSVTPAIPEAQLVDGSYRRIEFKIKPNRTLEGTDPLLNNAIYLAGSAMVGQSPVPFTVSFRIEEEFKLMGAGALKVDAGATNALTVAFNPVTWFAGVDFATATLDATGTAVISPDSNPEIWKVIRGNVKRSTRFGEDEDGDGELKDDESEGDGEEADEAGENEDEEGEDSEDEGDEDLGEGQDEGSGDEDSEDEVKDEDEPVSEQEQQAEE